MIPPGSEQMKQRFAENIVRLRKDREFSQEELAWRTGIHRTQVSSFENAVRLPRFATLIALAGGLETSMDPLFEGIVFQPLVVIAGGFRVVGQADRGDER
jgi:transcriptional regulator with XRE-family HTH domain